MKYIIAIMLMLLSNLMMGQSIKENNFWNISCEQFEKKLIECHKQKDYSDIITLMQNSDFMKYKFINDKYFETSFIKYTPLVEIQKMDSLHIKFPPDLLMYCNYESIKTAEYLISIGHNVNYQSDAGETILFCNASNLEYVELMLKNGFNINLVNHSGINFIHDFILRANDEQHITEGFLLLKKYVPKEALIKAFNSYDQSGLTPMHYLVEIAYQTSTYDRAIELGANPLLKSKGMLKSKRLLISNDLFEYPTNMDVYQLLKEKMVPLKVMYDNGYMDGEWNSINQSYINWLNKK